jgi:hypothetical protein
VVSWWGTRNYGPSNNFRDPLATKNCCYASKIMGAAVLFITESFPLPLSLPDPRPYSINPPYPTTHATGTLYLINPLSTGGLELLLCWSLDWLSRALTTRPRHPHIQNNFGSSWYVWPLRNLSKILSLIFESGIRTAHCWSLDRLSSTLTTRPQSSYTRKNFGSSWYVWPLRIFFFKYL